MKTTIQRWSNDLALRIPQIFIKEMNLTEGMSIDLTMCCGRLSAAPTKRKYRLVDLIKDIKPSQKHHEQFTDAPVGKEIW
jgi:antitoxin component of MazEF toxin-antitoxin module